MKPICKHYGLQIFHLPSIIIVSINRSKLFKGSP